MIQNPGFLLTVLAFVAVIGPLVFVHELGHYLVGRWFGVKAEAFSIGFGPELFAWVDRRGTRWRGCRLPVRRGSFGNTARPLTARPKATSARWPRR